MFRNRNIVSYPKMVFLNLIILSFIVCPSFAQTQPGNATLELLALFQSKDKPDEGSVKRLIKAGANVNKRSDNGMTPLYKASMEGHTDIVKLLIEANADVNITETGVGSTPVFISSYLGHMDVVRLLVAAKANVNLPVRKGDTPLQMASQEGHTSIVKMLLAAGANVNTVASDGLTPLVAASGSGHIEIVEILLSAGANINTIVEGKPNPLLVASQEGHTEIVKLLLTANATVNDPVEGGRTPLFMAARGGHKEIAKLLISASADVNAARDDGVMPLDIALQNGHTDIVKLLIRAKADVNNYAYGVTPLFVASYYGYTDTVRLLLEAGAAVNTIATIKGEKSSPLKIARKRGHNEIVEVIKEYSAYTTSFEQYSNSQFHFSFGYPVKWSLFSPGEVENATKGKLVPGKNMAVLVANPKDWNQNVNVAIGPGLGRAVTNAELEQLVKIYDRNLSSTLSKFRRISTSNIVINGARGLEYIYQFKNSSLSMQQKQVTLFGLKRSYVITATSKKRDFTKNDHSVFSKIVDSFKIVN